MPVTDDKYPANQKANFESCAKKIAKISCITFQRKTYFT